MIMRTASQLANSTVVRLPLAFALTCQGKVKNVDLKGSISPPITLDVTGVF
jgi:hypothetical protein